VKSTAQINMGTCRQELSPAACFGSRALLARTRRGGRAPPPSRLAEVVAGPHGRATGVT
jgi:hypothetical protein